MQLKRILVLSLVLAVVGGIATFAMPASHWVRSELQRRVEEPAPVLANSQEARQIIATVLAEKNYHYHGLPPPPPKNGKTLRVKEKRDLVVSAVSVCFRAEHAPQSPHCMAYPTGSVQAVELDGFASRKLREELILANANPRPLDLKGLPNTEVVDPSEVKALLTSRFWKGFYEQFPQTAGWVQASMPVLTKDRQNALVYISHSCDGLCGTGTLYYLSRTADGWTVTRDFLLWVS